MSPSAARQLLTVPELGPSLGRLVAPPPVPAGSPAHWIVLDDLRVGLVSALFELTGDARRWAREGDRELALATLSRESWEAAWQATVAQVAARAAEAINERMRQAAREARLPARRARRLPLDPGEVAALGTRLQAGAGPLLAALAALDAAAHATRGDRASQLEWQEALAAAGRRQESAWLALEAALQEEWRSFGREVEEIRAWRRPLLPLLAGGGILAALALWAGLMIGGYLPVPGPLRGLMEGIWARWN